MPRLALTALAVVIALVSALAAQQSPPPAPQPAATLVGLPVFSSDGQKLGEVTSAATVAGKTAVRVEMGAFLGLGPSQVLVDHGVYQRKGDRLELNMSAIEVKET